MDRRRFLRLVGAGCGVGAASWLGVGRISKLFGQEKSLERLLALDSGNKEVQLRVVPFYDFDESLCSSDGWARLYQQRPWLCTYLQNPCLLSEIATATDEMMIADMINADPIRASILYNADGFTEHVLTLADDLGYNKFKLSRLKVQEAMLLSAKIVSKQMNIYRREVDGDKLGKFYVRGLHALVGRSVILDSIGDQHLQEIDNLPSDIVFQRGKGVCRHYAAVNSAVFSVLKSICPALQNAYVRMWYPEDVYHMFAVTHAWNMGCMVQEINDKIVANLTFVEPTWLDDQLDWGIVAPADEVSAYDAYDEQHFSAEKFFWDVHAARLIEASDAPWQEAVKSRLYLCEKLCAVAQKYPNQQALCKSYMNESWEKIMQVAQSEMDKVVPYFAALRKMYPVAANLFPKECMRCIG